MLFKFIKSIIFLLKQMRLGAFGYCISKPDNCINTDTYLIFYNSLLIRKLEKSILIMDN